MIKLGEAAKDENGALGYEAHRKGDQLSSADGFGQEVRFISYYNKPWQYVFRCNDANVRNALAIRMEQCVRNQHIGYGQPDRAEIKTALAADPDPSKITKDIDCDCSSLVNSIVWCTLKSIGANPIVNGLETTAMMPERYLSMPQWFSNVAGSVDLNTGSGLMRGDILVRPSSHTAMVVEVTEDTRKGTVSTALYMREAPVSGKVVLTIPKGASVEILGSVKASNGATWYKVKYGGKEGYSSARYIK